MKTKKDQYFSLRQEIRAFLAADLERILAVNFSLPKSQLFWQLQAN